ncbi:MULTISPECIES: FtsQ-type POTRA domain-containing protein [unclassified Corynebacterium]|uniref:cell division protein FtsQ/DivIB n=1 Tax=unclassified Corynebacterium TaxID=2624378 RepID=UPI001C440690|nr:FtsQ-type POTRA domain-containing protein [Corynebacterium sp. TAE3-ERU30]MBV7301291.1 FtsQ-type POTRA domain-containing protein [Corynebacterium sp. TAE3-ERU2]
MSRRRIVQAFGAVIALGAVAVLICVFFPIITVSQVSVEGNKETSTEEVLAAAGVVEGENSLRVDTAGAASRVAELPWVKSATVGHSSPRGIEVQVVEREPFIFSEQADGAHLADRDGVPFVISDDPRGAMKIVGMSDDNPKIYAAVVDAVNAWEEIAGDQRGLLRFVEAPSPFELTLHFENAEMGAKAVYWGSAEDAANKARATRAVLTRPEDWWNVSNPNMVTTR